jgi:hypothetical protein
MDSYDITPRVDAAREFLEIAGDFTNPLELVREAISNSMDAGATAMKIEFSQPRQAGVYVLTIVIEDNGRGMNRDELQSFFDLGNSRKRNRPELIGEKGHGTKVYFNCESIQVETTQENITLVARMDRPYASLHAGHLPLAKVTAATNSARPAGTRIVILGFNANQGECFTHAKLRDYIQWFTKFGSFESQFGQKNNDSKVIDLQGLDASAPERIDFGHLFPDESQPVAKLFDTFVTRAPDHYCKRVMREGTLRRYPGIRFQALFHVEGNKVKQSYNPMIRRPGYQAPAGAYTVQERYGIWLCKDFIPIERKNEWISSKGSEFTKFHAFLNCQELSLTANRGSVANTPQEVLADIKEAVQEIYNSILASDDWRDLEWLETEAGAYNTAAREKQDFAWRQQRAIASNTTAFKNEVLVQPTRESGVYALLIQLALLQPDLFPFSIIDYDTHSGIDVIAKLRDPTPVNQAQLFYVELKYYFEARMNHSFDNMRYVVCWDTEVKHGGKASDVSGQERTLNVVPPDPKAGNYTGYFLRRDFKQDIEVFVLKDYLSEKLGLEFRPRSGPTR